MYEDLAETCQIYLISGIENYMIYHPNYFWGDLGIAPGIMVKIPEN